MKVTLSSQMDSTTRYLGEAAERLMNAQKLVTSGKKISLPSDDPTLAGRAMSIRSGIRGLEQYQENNNLAKSVLDSTDAAIGSITDEIQLLRQAASQAGNSSLSEEAKQGLLTQIRDIRDRLLTVADQKFLDRYLFSGCRTTTPPLAPSGGSPPYVYQGDADAIQIQIQPGSKISTNVTAQQLFNLNGSAGAGTKDIFSVIRDLETAVQAGDVASTSNSLGDIDDNLTNVLGLRAQIGARAARLEGNASALTDSKNRMAELLSNLEDTDMTQAIIGLQTQQNVYQAALAVASKIMQTSLVDYMR